MSNSDYKSLVDQFTDKNINRRKFLLYSGAVAGGMSLGGILAYIYKNHNVKPPFSKTRLILVKSLHDHLFPKTDESPGASDIKSVEYLEFVLIDPNIDEDNRNLLKNGFTRLEEESTELFQQPFHLLSINEKDELLRSIEEYNWGYRFISLNLTYLFEALLADPIYGGNPDEIGWKWLGHTPGIPRPTSTTMYKKK